VLDGLCFVSCEVGSGYVSQYSAWATCWMVYGLCPGRWVLDISVNIVTRLHVGWSVFCIPGVVRTPVECSD
jgi:hypothetical protein